MEKDKKTWNINQCEKKAQQRRKQRKRSFFMEKRRQKKRVLLQSQKVTHFFGTVFYTKKHKDCVGCDIVQADHTPEAGVAEGIFHGILVRHHRNQEEVEVGLEEEVERRVEENTQEQVRMSMTMDGTKTHRRDLSQM